MKGTLIPLFVTIAEAKRVTRILNGTSFKKKGEGAFINTRVINPLMLSLADVPRHCVQVFSDCTGRKWINGMDIREMDKTGKSFKGAK